MIARDSAAWQNLSLLEQQAAEIRDVVEGIYGAPTKTRRGVTIVLAQVACAPSLRPCWIAKVKYGSLIVAKCGTPPCGHWDPEDALGELLANTKRALGERS